MKDTIDIQCETVINYCNKSVRSSFLTRSDEEEGYQVTIGKPGRLPGNISRPFLKEKSDDLQTHRHGLLILAM